MIAPIFLLSLPRSGSTLLQRILATHPQIHTASEPWVMLPLLAALDEEISVAQFGYRTMSRAIKDFCTELPGGKADYLACAGRFMTDLYNRASPTGARYFLDKTPRYHLIARDLLHVFPDAHFIILWRNPIAAAASMLETFGNGDFKIKDYEIDLFAGTDRLLQACEAAPGRILQLRFEDILEQPHSAVNKIARHLDLDADVFDLAAIRHVRLKGRMGDHAGTQRYERIDREPADKWKTTMASPIRKIWCRRYLRWLGPRRLAAMGYDYDNLLRDVSKIPAAFAKITRDLPWWLLGHLNVVMELRLMRDKIGRRHRNRRIYTFR